MTDKTTPAPLGQIFGSSPPPKWTPDRDDTLVCVNVRQETHDVKSFLFRPRTASAFRHLPGQFITLELDVAGETINRCYTISSPPTRPDTLSITVKRKAGGQVSPWLHENMKPGMAVKVLGPSGDFSYAHHNAAKYLFLSGGSGVTPLMSMSRTFYDLGDDQDIIFIHSARTPKDIIFRRELGMMVHGAARFRTAFICETAAGEPSWSGPTGMLTSDLLTSLAPDFAAREVFCCGPAPYMAAVRAMLGAAHFDMTRYHEESFSFETRAAAATATAAEAPPAKPAPTGQKFKIEFTRQGRTIECGPDEFILEAARAAGMRLPFSCAKGLCGTCKSKKISGEVSMQHQGGIRQREIDAGMILPCCSKPLSDVVIEK